MVVVGAGLAGLIAARALEAAGRSTRRARGARPGRRAHPEHAARRRQGRPRSAASGSGPTQDRVLALADELGIETFPTYHEGRNLLELGGKRKRYKGTIPRLAPHVLLDIDRARRRLRPLAQDGAARGALEGAATPSELDAITLGGLARSQRPHRAGPARLFEIACGTVWGMTPGADVAAVGASLRQLLRAASTRWSTPRAAPSRTASSAARR